MTSEHLFASFMLDFESRIEIALDASIVVEAIRKPDTFMSVPTTVDFLEGIMNLRGEIIPIINLKKRLHLDDVSYEDDARIAVVQSHEKLYGILFEDIRDVLRVPLSALSSISQELQTEDHIIKGIIKLEDGNRLIQFIDLDFLFTFEELQIDLPASEKTERVAEQKARNFKRNIIFRSRDHEYGVPVEQAREITAPTSLNNTFESGIIAGSTLLRGATIPVITASQLIHGKPDRQDFDEETRLLILLYQENPFGLLVDKIVEIMPIDNGDLMPISASSQNGIMGIYQASDERNIMMLNIQDMLKNSQVELDSIANLGLAATTSDNQQTTATSKHIINENSYLVFQVERNFAVELINVREIIDNIDTIPVPGQTCFHRGVINLRGEIIPIINLRSFYGFSEQPDNTTTKFIVVSDDFQSIAIEVDDIVTILKQEKFYKTPQLNDQLRNRQDTLSRTIETTHETGGSDNILVLDVKNMISNHLNLKSVK